MVIISGVSRKLMDQSRDPTGSMMSSDTFDGRLRNDDPGYLCGYCCGSTDPGYLCVSAVPGYLGGSGFREEFCDPVVPE